MELWFSVTAHVTKPMWFNFSKTFSRLVGLTFEIISKSSSFCCHFIEYWGELTFFEKKNGYSTDHFNRFITSEYGITI